METTVLGAVCKLCLELVFLGVAEGSIHSMCSGSSVVETAAVGPIILNGFARQPDASTKNWKSIRRDWDCYYLKPESASLAVHIVKSRHRI